MKRMKKSSKKALALIMALIMVMGTIAVALPLIGFGTYDLKVDANGNFKILQIGDVQTCYPIPDDWINAIRIAVGSQQPNLIVMTGDNITGCSNATAYRNTVTQIVNEFKDVNGNDIPFAVTFGNHEIDSNSNLTIAQQNAFFAEKSNYVELERDNLGDSIPLGTGYIDIGNAAGTNVAERVILINSGSYDPEGGYGKAGYSQDDYSDKSTCEANYYAVVSAVDGWTNDTNIKCIAFQHIPLQEFYLGDSASTKILKQANTQISSAYLPYLGSIRHDDIVNYYAPNTDNPTVTGIYTEQCCASGGSTIALYNALAKDNVVGIFYGHDHGDTITGVTTVGGKSLRQGYGGGINTEWNGAGKSFFSTYTVNVSGTLNKESYDIGSYMQKLGTTYGFRTYANGSEPYIYDIGVGEGSNWSNAKSDVRSNIESGCPLVSNFVNSGSDANLNSNSGGKNIVMGYTNNPGGKQPITDVMFVLENTGDAITINKYGKNIQYTRIDHTDLNSGAGGAYIYCYVTRDPLAGAPITNLYASNSADYSSLSITKDYRVARVISKNYTVADLFHAADLNSGAGGDFIYLEMRAANAVDYTKEYFALAAAIDKYGKVTNDNDEYNQLTWNTYDSAKTAASQLFSTLNSAPSSSSVNNVAETYSALKTAYNNLKLKAADSGMQVSKDDSATGYQVAVPETVYLTPDASSAKTGQFYLNDKIDSNGNIAVDGTSSDTGKFEFKVPSDVTNVSVNVVRMTGTSFNADGSTGYNTDGKLVVKGNFTSGTGSNGNTDVVYSYAASVTPSNNKIAGTISYLYLGDSNGIAPGGTSLLEWRFTVTRGSFEEETIYAYTVVYAPFITTVFGAGRSIANKTYDKACATSALIYGVQSIEASYRINIYIGKTKISQSDTYPDRIGTYIYTPIISDSYQVPNWSKKEHPSFIDDKIDPDGNADTKKGAASFYDSDAADVTTIGGVGNIIYDSSRMTKLGHIPNLGLGADILGLNTTSTVGDNAGSVSAHYYLIKGTLSEENTVLKDITYDNAQHKSTSGKRVRANISEENIPNVLVSYSSYSTRYGGIAGNTGSKSANAYASCTFTPISKSTIRSDISNYQQYAPQSDWYTESSKFNSYMNELVSSYYNLGNPTSTATTTSFSTKYNEVDAVSYTYTSHETNYLIKTRVTANADASYYVDEARINDVQVTPIKSSENVSVQPYAFTGYTYKGFMDGEGFKSAYCEHGYTGAEGFLPKVGDEMSQNAIANLYDDFVTSERRYYGHLTPANVNKKMNEFYFYYEPTSKYQLTINYNGGSYASAGSKTVSAETGVSFNLGIIPSREGYVFGGWTFSGGGTYDTATNQYTFGTANGTLTAKWISQRTLTINADGVSSSDNTVVLDGGIAKNNLIYFKDGVSSLQKNSSTHYPGIKTIKDEAGNDQIVADETKQYTASISATFSYEDDSDITITGRRTQYLCEGQTGTFKTNYGNVSDTEVVIGATDLLVNLKEGHEYSVSFDSTNNKTGFYIWTPDGKHSNMGTSQSLNSDGTIHYASTFTPGVAKGDSAWATSTNLNGTYTIRLDQDAYDEANNGIFTISNFRIVENTDKDGSDNETVTQLEGTSRLIQNPEKTDYIFEGWTGSNYIVDNNNGTWTYTYGSSDETIVALWTPVINITFRDGGTENIVKIKSGDSTGKAFPTKDSSISGNNVFIGWNLSSNGSGTWVTSETTFNESKTVYAVYKTVDDLDDLTVGSTGNADIDPDGWTSREIVGYSKNAPAEGTAPLSEEANEAFGSTIKGSYGDVTIGANGELNYKPTNMQWGANVETIYANIKNTYTYTVGSETESVEFYSYSPVNIYPQTNILFEEDAGIFADATGENDAKWVEQKTNRGTQPISNAQNVYGYSKSYANDIGYSNDRSMTASVNNSQSTWPTYTFTFTGTGFDLYSNVNNESGLMMIQVTGPKSTVSTVNMYSKDTLYQVPVYHKNFGVYGTYTVKVTAVYNAAFDMTNDLQQASALGKEFKNGNTYDFSEYFGEEFANCEYYCIDEVLSTGGIHVVEPELVGVHNPVEENQTIKNAENGYDINIDGVRIYNPAGLKQEVSNTDIKDRYFDDKEIAPDYQLMRDNLGKKDVDGYTMYVDGTSGNFNYEVYDKTGPNNEVYLSAGQAISFELQNYNNQKVHISLRAPKGAQTVAVVNSHEIPIYSATEEYYDVTNFITESNGSYVLTIGCKSGVTGILSIGSVKLLESAALATDLDLALVGSAASFANAVNMLTALSEEEPVPDTEDITFTFDFSGVSTTEKLVDEGALAYAEVDGVYALERTFNCDELNALLEQAGLKGKYILAVDSAKAVAKYVEGEWIPETVYVKVEKIKEDVGIIEFAVKFGKLGTSTLSVTSDEYNIYETEGVKTASVVVSAAQLKLMFAEYKADKNYKLANNENVTLTAKYIEGEWKADVKEIELAEIVPEKDDVVFAVNFDGIGTTTIKVNKDDIKLKTIDGETVALASINNSELVELLAKAGLNDAYKLMDDGSIELVAKNIDGQWIGETPDIKLEEIKSTEPGTTDEPETPDNPGAGDEPGTGDEPTDEPEEKLTWIQKFINFIKYVVSLFKQVIDKIVIIIKGN